MKYRKKAIVVEARRCQEPEDPQDLAYWCDGWLINKGELGKKVCIVIDTLEGPMRADYGDWIIKGVDDEFYPCKDYIFKQTYEEVEDKSEKDSK
jgi:hypothetical protein